MPEPQPSSYEILAKLSRGTRGPAELFAARATGVERLVVIKRLRRDAAKEASIAQAFLAEARVAAKLAHPNIAQVYEVGKLGGSYFFTTEYVDGETLNALITHGRGKKVQVPIRAFLTIAAGAAAGLHHAHERNALDGKSLAIVHGNISPTNVMISREGIVKVLDFGLSRAMSSKLAYASPEQVRGDKPDRRSDLFSLGVVLWELLTLGDLHARDNDEETRRAIDSSEAPPPSARRFDVPPELDAILVKLLAKAPADRYQTGGDLLAALEALAVKLGFSLSTTDLARMMRLWFAPPGEGEGAEPQPDELTPITVTSQDILAEVAVGPDPVDELLASVREAAALIRGMAQKLGAGRPLRSTTGSPTPTGSEHEATREDFAQIRDRILEQARKRKESKSPPVGSPVTPMPSAVEPAPAAASGSDEGAPKRKKPDTLNPSNPYSYITAVAETATAPIANITKAHAEAGAALRALQATQAHVDANGTAASSPANDEVATASAAEAAKASTKVDARADAATNAAKSDGKPAAKLDAKSEAKADAKSEAKSDAKADAKSDAKADAKSATKAESKSVDKAKADDKTKPATSKNGVHKVGAVDASAKDRGAARSAVESDDDDEPTRRGGWIMPAVVVAAAALVLVFVLKGRGNKTSGTGSAGSSQVVASQTTGTAATTGGSAVAATNGSAGVVTATANNGTTGSAATASAATGSGSVATGSAATGAVATGSAATGSAAAGSGAGSATLGSSAAAATGSAAGSAATVSAGSAGSNGDKLATTDKTTTDKTTTDKTTTDKTTDKSTTSKTGNKVVVKTGDKTADKSTDATPTIEELYAKGEYSKTNAACAKNLIFTAERLQNCALAACRTNNTTLAKRWVNAIAKSARADVIAQCKGVGLDLEAGAPAPAAESPAPAPAPAP